MIWLYRILFPFVFLGLLPGFLRRMHKRGGYRSSTVQRLGFRVDAPAKPPGYARIWAHAVSVGELGAMEPLLRALARNDALEIVLTTTTSTGYALARTRMSELCSWIGWFPLDFAPCNTAFWNRLQPDLALLMEGELWPEHLYQAERRGVPVFLVNARLSDRSYRRYARFGRIARTLVFNRIHRILAASTQDAERWRTLAEPERVIETGNLKLDLPGANPSTTPSERHELLQEFGFQPASPEPIVLFGSSTWEGEEALLLDLLRRAREAGLPVYLVLVPRHAERRDSLRRLMMEHSFPYHFRTDRKRADHGNVVYVADTTGELLRLLQSADVVFVGKSLPPHEGGQNPIEAVSLLKPVVCGPRMSNFRDIAASLAASGAVRVADSEREVADTLLELLRDPVRRRTCAERAAAWIQQQRGALQATLREIEGAIPARE